MAKSRGLEKMFGTYTDPKKGWRDNNKEHISSYNSQYFQQNKQNIYARRAEQRAARAERNSRSFFPD